MDTQHLKTFLLLYECQLSGDIRHFLKNNNDIFIKITIGHSPDLLQMLKDEILDIVYSFIPLTKKDINATVLPLMNWSW